jgi:tetratricopeptide (TPR) repeat protein
MSIATSMVRGGTLLPLAGVGLACFLAVPRAAAGEQSQNQPSASAFLEQRRLADVLMSQGRFGEAIVEYRRWLVLHPGDAGAHTRLGVCLQKTNQTKAARRAYERAVQIEPCYAAAWSNLGTLEHVKRNFKRAVFDYRKAVDCAPDVARSHRNLGAVYLDMGDMLASTRSYAEALRLDPYVFEAASTLDVSTASDTTVEQYLALARVFALRGQKDGALKFIAMARARGFHDVSRLATDRAFADLVTDPRYGELLRR